MKRLLLVASLAVATSFAPALAGPPQVGTPGGYCDGDVDAVCRPSKCVSDLPCTIDYCGVWLNGKCFRG